MRSKLAGAANWTHFIWDEVAGTLLAEYTLISSTFTITSENTWGLGLISTNRGGTKRYFHFDGQGNTVALTDSSENITDTYGYTASGVVVGSQDSGTSVNPFKWQGIGGAYNDGAMGSSGGLILVRGIPYDPVIGRSLVMQQRGIIEIIVDLINDIKNWIEGIVGIPPPPPPGLISPPGPPCKESKGGEETDCGIMCRLDFPDDPFNTFIADCIDCCRQMFKKHEQRTACTLACHKKIAPCRCKGVTL